MIVISFQTFWWDQNQLLDYEERSYSDAKLTVSVFFIMYTQIYISLSGQHFVSWSLKPGSQLDLMSTLRARPALPCTGP